MQPVQASYRKRRAAVRQIQLALTLVSGRPTVSINAFNAPGESSFPRTSLRLDPDGSRHRDAAFGRLYGAAPDPRWNLRADSSCGVRPRERPSLGNATGGRIRLRIDSARHRLRCIETIRCGYHEQGRRFGLCLPIIFTTVAGFYVLTPAWAAAGSRIMATLRFLYGVKRNEELPCQRLLEAAEWVLYLELPALVGLVFAVVLTQLSVP